MIQRRKPEATKVNHDRWLVSYADLVTLLFGFFVVMYSVSQVNETEYRELSETLSAAFQGRSAAEMPADAAATVPAEGSPNLVSMRELQERVENALEELIQAETVTVDATDAWVQISVDANMLFASASATPSAEARNVFTQVAALLAPYSNAIEVSGHTDNVPIATAQFANNWQLSAARATAVVQILSRHGVAPHRLAATGYGEFRPVADNTTEAGRAQNRRVVLLVARHQAERPSVDLDALPDVNGVAKPAHNSEGPDTTPVSAPQPKAVTEPAQSAPALPSSSVPLVKPQVRKDGSLLFTNDPERDE